FSAMPPRLFRAVRLVPGLGDGMLRIADAAFPAHTLLTKRIRKGPLRDMVLDVDPRALDMVIGRYEPAIQSVIDATLRAGDVAFDVGSNLGYFTLLMAKKVAPGGRVVAFEPDPEMFAALSTNLTRNLADADHVTPLAKAAGAAAGKVRFARGWRATRGRVVPTGGDLEVETVALDDAADRFGTPRLLKIDVEGAELDVLRGARGVLKEARPLVLVEVHSTDLEIECARLLERLGYTCSRQADVGKKEPYLLAS
ncbi:MAG: FkbM family methyltransferase, partial [Actinomycetota bacterium]|nr:FkbM family methyltransferase [Actinomycetota bacterium]